MSHNEEYSKSPEESVQDVLQGIQKNSSSPRATCQHNWCSVLLTKGLIQRKALLSSTEFSGTLQFLCLVSDLFHCEFLPPLIQHHRSCAQIRTSLPAEPTLSGLAMDSDTMRQFEESHLLGSQIIVKIATVTVNQ